ncbi:MAG: hypothetical protein ACE5HX_17570 [bacterium]
MASSEELAEEQRKMRRLRAIVDLTAAVLYQSNLTTVEAMELVKAAKKSVLNLFPEKEATFDLIYKPRFERIIKEQLKSNN